MPAPIIIMLLAAFIVGCATTIPESIRTPAPGDVRVAEARLHPEQHRSQPMRWGGLIVSVENRKVDTILEIVARDLDRIGRPILTGQSPGRFLAHVEGFLDPEVYAKGREVTVSGTLTGSATRLIGEFSYTFPVVRADRAWLWEQRPTEATPYPYGHHYHDPFWPSPWYPRWHHP